MVTTNGDLEASAKAASPDVLSRSVVEHGDPAVFAGSPFVYVIAQVADAITPWGQSPLLRDRQLREFISDGDYMYSSALGTVVARNTAMGWSLAGGERTATAVQDMLLNSNRGRGWESLIAQTSYDLYNADRGAFWEIIRSGDSPSAPVINIAHLDSLRVYPTGDPETPVYYLDIKGHFHALKWYQVVSLLELPAPWEHPTAGVLYPIQWCSLTRMLRAAQIFRNIAILKDEKAAGRFIRAIHLIKGVSTQQIKDAMSTAQLQADQQGLLRYMQPLMVGSLEPEANVGHDTIELASLPDGFDLDKEFKWHLVVMAMAFFTDYQEFAPLPGGNLGTSAQSEILHLKARGKGPGLFRKLITHTLNQILPKNVTFVFDEQDVEADREVAEVERIRAETWKTMVDAGIVTPEAAAQLAVDAGTLPQELFDRMGLVDVTGKVTVGDEEGGDLDTAVRALADRIAVKAGSPTLSAFLQSRIHEAFTTAADRLYALGYMGTQERIQLSSVIGDALRVFSEKVEVPVGEQVLRDDDVRELLELAQGLKDREAEEAAAVGQKARATLSRRLRPEGRRFTVRRDGRGLATEIVENS